jgi:hypothetical protein
VWDTRIIKRAITKEYKCGTARTDVFNMEWAKRK